ncbi:MAG: tetratricopeptide repeat protein [Solobacterium sp.]|nr:tetratricopeptide repeat protein [Solobacterium sp.]
MKQNKGWLAKEDYEEPVCLLDGIPDKPRNVKPVPQQRIMEKVEEYMSRRDYAAVERHLLYWLEEAKMGNDERGELMIRNELIGHYRKSGKKEEALAEIREALRLLDDLDYKETRSAGTTYINCATALNAFGENERSLELFEEAEKVYEKLNQVDPGLLGGLYNNMALTCAALGRYTQAHTLYAKALELMGTVENGALEQAITCLNEADVYAAELGTEASEARVYALLDKAEELLKTEGIPHDGYYAFVCEKCAPAFEHYGYFLTAQDLKRQAQEIYERD